MNETGNRLLRTSIYTTLALIAFAANSVLCRLALGSGAIDAANFTSVRLLSGVVMLAVLVGIRGKRKDKTSGNGWLAGAMLFLYAVTFSYAYVTLDTATGALVLFGTVQITMVMASFFMGAKLHPSEWLGLLLALGGFLYLVLPEAGAPSLTGFMLMVFAGFAWAIYTLLGRASQNPLLDTFSNFLRTVPLVVALFLVTLNMGYWTVEGIIYAVMSGAIASGVGYALWYKALRGLGAIQAGVLQLSVPVIAAFGGVVFLAEQMTLQLLVSAFFILCGILILIVGKHYFSVGQEQS